MNNISNVSKTSEKKKHSLMDKFLEDPPRNFQKTIVPSLVLTAICSSIAGIYFIVKEIKEDNAIFGEFRRKEKAKRKAERKTKWNAIFHKGVEKNDERKN